MVSKPVAETNFKETENLQPIMLRYKGAPITDTGILHFFLLIPLTHSFILPAFHPTEYSHLSSPQP